MLSVTCMPSMLSFILLNVVMLNVVVPLIFIRKNILPFMTLEIF